MFLSLQSIANGRSSHGRSLDFLLNKASLAGLEKLLTQATQCELEITCSIRYLNHFARNLEFPGVTPKTQINHDLYAVLEDYLYLEASVKRLVSRLNQGQSPNLETSALEIFLDLIFSDIQNLMNHVTVQKNLITTEAALTSLKYTSTSVAQASSVQRLTKLAFIFIPFSLVATILSMNIPTFLDSASQLWVYIAIAVPLTTGTIYTAWFAHHMVPILNAMQGYRLYRIKHYLKDVSFKRSWLKRFLSSSPMPRNPFTRQGRKGVVACQAWAGAWVPGPPVGLVELDGTPIPYISRDLEAGLRIRSTSWNSVAGKPDGDTLSPL